MGGKSASKAGTATPAPGEDNNKRLAFLEAGVSSLALALAAAGVEVPEGGEPIGQAIALADNWKSNNLKLAEVIASRGFEVVVPEGPTSTAFRILSTIVMPADVTALAKRCDELEAGVSMLAVAMSGAGIELQPDVDLLASAANYFDQLAEAGAGGGGDDNATEGEIAAIARADAADARVKALEAENEELETDLVEMTNLRNAAVNELVAVKEGREPEAKPPEEPEPEPEPAPPRKRSEAARDVGPGFGRATAAEIAEILTELAGGELEIAFSNGEFEIVDFSPQPIERAALVYRGGKFHVEPAIFIRGAGQDEAIAGAALLLNGDQLDYCEFDSPIPIEPGQERKFERTFVFG